MLTRRIVMVGIACVMGVVISMGGGFGMAQESADTMVGERGVVRLPYPSPQNLTFVPQDCLEGGCSDSKRALYELVFPRVLAIDPQTHLYTGGTTENNGLAQSWSFSDDLATITLTLRDDARWRDGTPVTAYDVAYTLQEAYKRQRNDEEDFIALRVLNDNTLSVTLRDPSCHALNNLDVMVAPAHRYQPGYRQQFDSFFASATGDDDEQWRAWMQRDENRGRNYPDLWGDYQLTQTPVITGGRYEIVADMNHLRLTPTHGAGVRIEVVDGNAQQEPRVFRSDSGYAFVPDVPPVHRLPLRVNDAQLLTLPTSTWVALWFNVANPNEPQPAFDPETEDPIEQEPHPYFADRRVREAIIHAIDMDAIINDVLFGDAVAIPSDAPPTSWAYHPTLASPITYDLDRAEQLLQDAGWHWVAGVASRQCIACTTAPIGTTLDMSIVYEGNLTQIAEHIASNLRRIGVRVSTQSGSVQNQRFDIALTSRLEAYPAYQDHAGLFERDQDRPNGRNFTSYYNDEVVNLMRAAQQVPGCDIAQRRALYQQAQQMLYDDLVFVGLYSPTTVWAAQPTLQNFQPQYQQPLWGITEWIAWHD